MFNSFVIVTSLRKQQKLNRGDWFFFPNNDLCSDELCLFS